VTERAAPPPDLAGTLEGRIEALGPWYHNLRLPDRANGRRRWVQTAPAHPLGDFPAGFFRYFRRAVPRDLTGLTVLDVGCNAGFYAFELKRRGAARVLAVDHDPRYLRQAELARAQLGLDVEFRRLEAYQVDRLAPERFDLVLFLGVFYHLRHPLYALEQVARRVRGRLLFQTMERGPAGGAVAPDYPLAEREVFLGERYPRMYFVEDAYAGDATNWWIPNPAATRAVLRSCGLRITGQPCPEVYVCVPGAPPWWDREPATPAYVPQRLGAAADAETSSRATASKRAAREA
jgi:tRNA (mo5U34)-methyltransferase